MVGAPCYKAMVGPNNDSGVLTWPPGPPRFQFPYIQVSDNTFRGQDQGCFHSKIGGSIRKELINVDASVTNVCVSHPFTLVYLFLCCVHSPVASWHQVGGKRQDAVQSQDSRSLNHICTGTAGLLFLFQYWCGYTAGVPKCSTGGHRRAWFVRKGLLKGTTERKLKRFFLLGGTENPVWCESKDWIWATDYLV